MKRRSLTRHLLAWTLGSLVVVWASFVALAYATGQHEADELTDGHLASAAALLLAASPAAIAPAARVPPGMLAAQMKAHDYQQSMSVVVWDGEGAIVARTGAAPLPAFDRAEGFQTLALGAPASGWRAFSRWDEGHGRKVMVLLSLQERDDLAQDIAGQMAEPGLWLLPVVALVLGLAVRRGLRPLYALSADVRRLDIVRAAPLRTEGRHEELHATADAINTLMARYQEALARERVLASEFAHEMRTPLAAIALHAAGLRGLADEQAREAALARLQREVARAGHVLADLLALARASRGQWEEAARPVDLVALALEVVADFAPRADAAGQELSLAAPAGLRVDGHPLLLELALRNLVENALVHTGAGAQVVVEVDAPGAWVQVRDDGGRRPAGEAGTGERARVPGAGGEGIAAGAADEGVSAAAAGTGTGGAALGLGLGLGHRVVEKVAAVHGARFLRIDLEGGGRCYRIQFPSLTG